jgi:hypothetical protein
MQTIVPVEVIERKILLIPEDFMFQLSKGEAGALRFQSEILKTGEQSVEIKQGRGQHRKYLPFERSALNKQSTCL